MKDAALELLPDWRYCRIERGHKAPRYRDWPNTHYTLDQIPHNSNIGVLLGPASGGLLTVDFDGPTAFSWWQQHIPVDLSLIDTITWQGRRDRCQMAFSVPHTLWDLVPTKFHIVTGDGEQLEWRWSDGTRGLQSVVPPSIHPQLGEPYLWLRSPRDVPLLQIPDELLAWAIEYRQPPPEVNVTRAHNEPITEQQVSQLLDDLKLYVPRLDYENWFKVACIVANTVGDQPAAHMLQQRWPEEHRGEYVRKIRSRDPRRSGTLGGIVHLIRQYNANYRKPMDATTKLRNKLMKYY